MATNVIKFHAAKSIQSLNQFNQQFRIKFIAGNELNLNLAELNFWFNWLIDLLAAMKSIYYNSTFIEGNYEVEWKKLK